VARELKPCGTPAAYRRHLRRGETPCQECKRAETEYQQSRPAYRARHPVSRGPLQPCGTYAGYERHRHRGERICEECREANTARAATRRADAVANGLPAGAAHGESGYFNYGCRCETCRAAGAKKNARRYPVDFTAPH
jgi:hypothetical protein